MDAIGVTSRTLVVAASASRPARTDFSRLDGHHARIPAGLCHAVWLGAERTLCGAATYELVVFPGLGFAAIDFLPRCTDCVSASVEA